MSDTVDPNWQAIDRDRYFADLSAFGRECLVRSGKVPPETDEERRQAAEGEKKVIELDSFRNPAWRKPK